VTSPAGPPSPGPELPSDTAGTAGPVFAEPWQAEAFAIAAALSERGAFSDAEWANALGTATAAAQQAGDPDLGDTYYEHWVTAIESLCAEKDLLTPGEVDRRTEEWRQAFLRTPHGEPVELPRQPGHR
jgi:nitrile hydratase accessory protein